jgi:Na+-driven multidrug efflux pump
VIGSGHTAAISVIFTSFSLLRIPLSWALAAWTPLGPLAVAWTITLTCSARSLVIWWWFRRGKWKTGLGREIRPVEAVEIAPAEAT